jgi:hypothetical protein
VLWVHMYQVHYRGNRYLFSVPFILLQPREVNGGFGHTFPTKVRHVGSPESNLKPHAGPETIQKSKWIRPRQRKFPFVEGGLVVYRIQ